MARNLIRTTIIGDKKVIRALGRLADRARRRIVRQATTAAARPILKEAKSRVVRETGLLRKSLVLRSKANVRLGSVFVTIGPLRGFFGRGPDGRERRPIKYAHIVEFGSQTTAARPFMAPAFHAKRAEGIAKGSAILVKGIEREAAKK